MIVSLLEKQAIIYQVIKIRKHFGSFFSHFIQNLTNFCLLLPIYIVVILVFFLSRSNVQRKHKTRTTANIINLLVLRKGNEPKNAKLMITYTLYARKHTYSCSLIRIELRTFQYARILFYDLFYFL